MTTLTILLLITLLLPLAGFILLQGIGQRLGEPLAGYVGAGTALLTFSVSVITLIVWIYGGTSWGFHVGPYVDAVGWLPIGSFPGQRNDGFLDLAYYVDSLAVVMIAALTFVSAIVHLFSIAYMRNDPRYPQFYAYLSLLIFAMVGLLLSASLVQVLIAWELLGLCAYQLIGFWHEKPRARSAAVKTFITQRVGDVAFLTGMGIIIAYMGNTTLPDLWLTLGDPVQQIMSPTMLTAVGLLVVTGAMARCAQFPLHAWLHDATVGPTPVSALIHAATLVAAGVFVLARVYPILTPEARLVIVGVGAVSLTIGTLCAMAQRDLKKALALSTISQMGLMVLAIGVGSWIGALFHLLTHAFFKSLLFLCAGTVVHAMSRETRLEKYGGLYRRLPVTAVTFAIGGLAISGAPPFSGAYSQEMILAHIAAWCTSAEQAGRSGLFQAALWVTVGAVYLTPLYMTRLWMLTFAGRTRDRKHSRRATEAGIMSFSLVVLSGMTLVAGYAWFPIQAMVEESATETRAYTEMARIDPLAGTWPTFGSPAEIIYDGAEGIEIRQSFRTMAEVAVVDGLERVRRVTAFSWLLGIAVGVLIYARGFKVTNSLGRVPVIRSIRVALRDRLFFDLLYSRLIPAAVRAVSRTVGVVEHRVTDPLACIPAGGARNATCIGRSRWIAAGVILAATLLAGGFALQWLTGG